MNDLANAPSVRRRIDFATPEAQARLQKRYRKERRFRALGLGAIVVTTLFLVVLLTSIVSKGLPAFWQHSLLLDVTASQDAIDPSGKNDPVAIRGADFFPILRDALTAVVPVESRSGEKSLTRLLSNGAANGLGEELARNPGLIGKSLPARLLLSADADLFFKGDRPKVLRRAASGTATPSDTTGDITVALTGNVLATEIAELRREQRDSAAKLSAEADRLERVAAEQQRERIKELRDQAAALKARIDAPKIDEALDSNMPSLLLAMNGGMVKVTQISDGSVAGTVLLPLKDKTTALADTWHVVRYLQPESNRKLNDEQVTFLERLESLGKVERRFNWAFFATGDSREPELAGIRGALVGSALTLMITLALCLPTGVMAAIYLEEFAPKNRLTEIIEININNLAAVPSIVFGLLGLAMFLNFFGLPRSAPLVGGLVLALLVLPTIIIAARAALKAVPPSIKEAALGVGASHQQAIFHHVLPLATPGIMTGTIIGMAHALGETAPLLMIGMVAFIVDVPGAITDAATVLPVQIYLWSDLPERGFETKTAAAIIVLIGFLFVMNGAAIWLRKKFERRW